MRTLPGWNSYPCCLLDLSAINWFFYCQLIGCFSSRLLVLPTEQYFTQLGDAFSRFQALTNTVLDTELDLLRKRLGLAPNQKAELLREMAALAGWVTHQAEQGRTIEARRDGEIEPLCIRRWNGCA
ncbi:MAG: hypothetical protein R3F37_15955 [Candidatus Competibacteraceae bacterium]